MKVESKSVPAKMSSKSSITVLKALADSTRLQIAGALIEKPHCTEELADRFDRAPATISFHLKKLDEAGLVLKKKTQYYLMYEFRRELLDISLGAFIDPETPDKMAREAQQRTTDAYRDKVLRTFFKKGRLLQMPKQWRKRIVILEAILPVFKEGRIYLEKEVDEKIHTFADDHCRIRRMLIDEGFMSRSGQKYQRISKEPMAMNTDTQKKQSKREFKEAPKEAGIFRITNTQNKKVYLGSSLNLHGPLNKHQFTLSMGSHINKAMQKDWKQYGEEAFQFEIVETVKPTDDPSFNVEDELQLLEEIWSEREHVFSENSYNRRKKIRE